MIATNSLVALYSEKDQIVLDVFKAAKGDSARQKAEAASEDLKEMKVEISADRIRHIAAQDGSGL